VEGRMATENEEVSEKIAEILSGSLKISRNLQQKWKVSLVYFCDFNGRKCRQGNWG
jgi:hypothetical protein